MNKTPELKYTTLYRMARVIKCFIDTQRADDFPEIWEWFGFVIERAYRHGRISAHEFDKLALTAFYDYPGEMKEHRTEDEMKRDLDVLKAVLMLRKWGNKSQSKEDEIA